MRVLPVAFLALLASLSFCLADDQFVNVVGFAECADCEKSGIKTSQAFSGLNVKVECKAEDGHVETSQAVELNEEGKYTVPIPQKLAKLSKECYAKLHSASLAPCSSKVLIKQDLSITEKLKFSREICESKFFWKHPLPPFPKLPPHPWKKTLPPFHPITLPPFHFPHIPVIKKPCTPPFKPPTPDYIPPPVPVYKPPPKPAPTPVPVYTPTPKPTPTPVPVYKPPPPPVPVYKPKPKPTPTPVPVYKPKPTPIIKKPCPPVVIIKPHPLTPLIHKFKKPFPKIDPHKFFHHPKFGKIIPKFPKKYFKHP